MNLREISQLPRRRFSRRYDASSITRRPTTLLPRAARSIAAQELLQVASFNRNAGDLVLPVTVRDIITARLGVTWQAQHVHHPVDSRFVERANRTAGVVIGGGGLFLRDTNPNEVSGWQWAVSDEALKAIRVPIAVFAVGYNQFRQQVGFDPLFTRNVTALLDRSAFFGLRNRGSIEAISRMVPEELAAKITFQPCPTTLVRRLYPWLDRPVDEGAPIALNCAFDRTSLRFGNDLDRILEEIAWAVAALQGHRPIRYYAHLPGDEQILPVLASHGVRYELHRLYLLPRVEVFRRYAEAALVIGMRGHAQMIPFGLGRPIVSIISHEKLRYFLDDISCTDLAIDVLDKDLEARLVSVVEAQLDDQAAATRRMHDQQANLWDLTATNLDLLAQHLV